MFRSGRVEGKAMLIRCLLTFLALAGLAGTAVSAQEQSVRLHGTISAIEGSTIAVNTGAGTTRVVLDEKPRVNIEEPADLSKIKSGDFIGSGAVPQPDGTQRAVEVHIFAESMRGTGEGFHPWTGAANGTMTNATVNDVGSATVEGVSGRVLTLTYKGGQQKLFVPPGTPVVRFTPGDRAAVAVGAHVSVNAVKHADGTLSAAGLNVGKNGFTPPL
jgi:hypothetical protein